MDNASIDSELKNRVETDAKSVVQSTRFSSSEFYPKYKDDPAAYRKWYKQNFYNKGLRIAGTFDQLICEYCSHIFSPKQPHQRRCSLCARRRARSYNYQLRKVSLRDGKSVGRAGERTT
jgi:hypothetical protein